MSELDTNCSMIPPFTTDDRINELAEINKELTGKLKEAYKLLGEYVTSTGGCDHSVGICMCYDRNLLDEISELIAKAEK